jgi:dCTP deaminase
MKADQLVTPFRPERVANAAYELALGTEAFVTSSLDGKKTSVTEGGQLVIPPGQFALLLTDEVVRIPAEAIGLISIKASMKFKGLVNVSGFHVDPGFNAKLKFSVYNAGSNNIILDQGKGLFLLWLCDLSAPTPPGDLYKKSAGKNGISGQDIMHLHGEVASPAALKKELEEVRRDVAEIRKAFDQARAILVTIGVALLISYLKEHLARPSVDGSSHNALEFSKKQPESTAPLNPQPTRKGDK